MSDAAVGTETAWEDHTAVENRTVWDDAPWEGLRELDAEIEAEVCVVGLGGSGLACIGELLRMGRRVVGLDAGTVAGGAAGRNGGFLLAGSYDFYHDAVVGLGRERALGIYRLTLAELDRIEAETPDSVRRGGSLRIAASADELRDCERQLAAMREDGLPVEPYEGAEGRGLLMPTDGAFQPVTRCRTLARRASAAGAQLFENSPGLSIAGTGVTTPCGRVRCERVILAVDGRLERLLPELAGRVRTARLQMLATAPTEEIRLRRPVYSRYGFDYWQQLPDGSIALGGCRDLDEAAEWTDAARPTERIQAALERLLRESLGVRAPIRHRWAASVAYSRSGLPILEEVRPRLWAIGAYSGTGNVIGAICGRAAARLAFGEASDAGALLRSA